jgi:hypothetical protein
MWNVVLPPWNRLKSNTIRIVGSKPSQTEKISFSKHPDLLTHLNHGEYYVITVEA